MGFDFGILVDECIEEFGDDFTFTRIASSGQSPLTISGIAYPGVTPDEAKPGEDAIYFGLEIKSTDIDPDPKKGDEIASPVAVYKIYHIEKRIDGSSMLHLRKDREL